MRFRGLKRRSSYTPNRAPGAKRFRSIGTQTRFAKKKRSTSGVGVTVQHDERRVYRKSKMPRRRRKAWRRKVRMVHAIAEKDYGTNTIVFNKTQEYFNTTAGNHCIAIVPLYSMQSGDTTTFLFHNDLNTIGLMFNSGNPTAATGGTLQQATKLLFQSGVLDVTIRNTSGTIVTPSSGTTPPVVNQDSSLVMEVDVYEMTSGRDWSSDLSYGSINSMDRCFANGQADTLNLGGAGTGVDIFFRGVTPFDVPLALSRYRLKVWKKTKYFLTNGGQFTYQIRDPKRRVVSAQAITDQKGANWPGWTRHLFIIAKLTPGATVGNLVSQDAECLQIGATRKYMVKVEGFNEDRDRYFVG